MAAPETALAGPGQAIGHLLDRGAYEAFYRELGEDPVYWDLECYPAMLVHFQPEAGSTILELGCGTGRNLVHYAALGCLGLGIELSPGMVRAGRRIPSEQGPEIADRVRLLQGWIEDLEVEDRFDYVLVTEVLEHVIEPVSILRVARRHLKKGGEVFISAPAIRIGSTSHARGVPFAELEGWMRESDLRSIWNIEQPNRRRKPFYPKTVCRAVAA